MLIRRRIEAEQRRGGGEGEEERREEEEKREEEAEQRRLEEVAAKARAGEAAALGRSRIFLPLGPEAIEEGSRAVLMQLQAADAMVHELEESHDDVHAAVAQSGVSRVIKMASEHAASSSVQAHLSVMRSVRQRRDCRRDRGGGRRREDSGRGA